MRINLGHLHARENVLTFYNYLWFTQIPDLEEQKSWEWNSSNFLSLYFSRPIGILEKIMTVFYVYWKSILSSQMTLPTAIADTLIITYSYKCFIHGVFGSCKAYVFADLLLLLNHLCSLSLVSEFPGHWRAPGPRGLGTPFLSLKKLRGSPVLKGGKCHLDLTIKLICGAQISALKASPLHLDACWSLLECEVDVANLSLTVPHLFPTPLYQKLYYTLWNFPYLLRLQVITGNLFLLFPDHSLSLPL